MVAQCTVKQNQHRAARLLQYYYALYAAAISSNYRGKLCQKDTSQQEAKYTVLQLVMLSFVSSIYFIFILKFGAVCNTFSCLFTFIMEVAIFVYFSERPQVFNRSMYGSLAPKPLHSICTRDTAGSRFVVEANITVANIQIGLFRNWQNSSPQSEAELERGWSGKCPIAAAYGACMVNTTSSIVIHVVHGFISGKLYHDYCNVYCHCIQVRHGLGCWIWQLVVRRNRPTFRPTLDYSIRIFVF